MTATMDAETTESFQSLNPATGETVGEHPVHGEEAVNAAIARARDAAAWWAGLGWKERRVRLLNVKGALPRSLTRVAMLIPQETVMTALSAQLYVALAFSHTYWAARMALMPPGPSGWY